MAEFIAIQPGGQDDPLVAKLFVQSNVSNTDLGSMLNLAFQLAFSAGAILAMIRLMYGGFLYMGRSGEWSSKQKAKDVLQNAIIGLLILSAVWIILNQINPDILKVGFLDSVKNTQNAGQ